MTLKELQKLIDNEVSALNVPQENTNEPLREPQVQRPKRPVYKPALKTEDEIDLTLFHCGKKPENED